MAAIPTVIGGHTVRDPPQLDAGASVNMFPERSKRETEYQQRVSRFQLSTHGYQQFVRDTNLPPVTAMAGSRERLERLLVANGRTLRVFDRPDNSGSLSPMEASGYPAQANTPRARTLTRLRPVLGCANVNGHAFPNAAANPIYYVRDDGEIWWNQRGKSGGAERIETGPGAHLDGITPLGLACTPLGGNDPLAGGDVGRIFVTCAEDRIIRCWRRTATGVFTRDEKFDLDLSIDTAVNTCESLWIDPGDIQRRMLILDTITGRVLEYGLDEDAATSDDVWSRRTPLGLANPFSFQRIAGDSRTLEPVPFGGVFSSEAHVRVVDRENSTERVAERRTGLATTSDALPDLSDGATVLPAACGAVSGVWNTSINDATRIWYVNGAQYPDGLGRLWAGNVKLTNYPDLPDAPQRDPGPGYLVPLGDEGRHVGWVVDRRLHVIDLLNDRIITDVEGNVDSLAYNTGRLLAADASIGELKISPVNQIRAVDTERYGELVPSAQLRVPAVSFSLNQNNRVSFEQAWQVDAIYVGIREVLTLANNRLIHYNRTRLHQQLPVVLNTIGAARRTTPELALYGLTIAGDDVLVLSADAPSANTVTIRRYDVPPNSPHEFGDQIPDVAAFPPSPTTNQRVRLTQAVGARGPGFYQWNEDVSPPRWDPDPTPRLLDTRDKTVSGGVSIIRTWAGSSEWLFGVRQNPSIRATIRVWQMDAARSSAVSVMEFGNISFVTKAGTTNVMVPDVDNSNTATAAAARVFEGLEFDNPVPNDWIRGITFVENANAAGGGYLLVAIRQREGLPTVIRAFVVNVTRDPNNAQRITAATWQRADARDLTTEASTENRMLTHDAQFVFDSSGVFVTDQLQDRLAITSTRIVQAGEPIRATVVAPFRHDLVERLSQYSWDPEQRNLTGVNSVAAIRRQLYAWTATGMEIRDLADETEGFPYRLREARTIGLIAPASLAVVADVLYWLGVTEGGGLRVWRVGQAGDLVPEYVEGKAIEEMFDRIAQERPEALTGAVGWADDTGGHPTYVLWLGKAGVSVAYDADADRWHARASSLTDAERAARMMDTAAAPMTWPWLEVGTTGAEEQGVQRVAHSTTWRQRLVCGGYDEQGNGVVAHYSTTDFRDIDGGPVLRRRQFAAGEAERMRVKFRKLRVDAVYNVPLSVEAMALDQPRFAVYASDNGGESFPKLLGERDLGPPGAPPPRPFYRAGYSRQRVYRVDCSAAAPFALMGAYQEANA